jgi:hypothetical protein
VRSLQIGDEVFGGIHARKTVDESRIWLTSKSDATWWVVIEGPDQKIRTVGFVRPPQEQRARETYASLSKLDVLTALLEGRDS